MISKTFRALALATAATVASACGGDSKTGAADSTGSPTLRVALLTPGPISDKSWNGGAYDGLTALRDSLGAQISHIQTKTPAEFEENFRQYGAQGYTVVVGHGFEFQDAATRVAPSYPKTNYIVTSGRVTGPNLAGVAFLFEEASYQAGMIAGAVTKSNKLGLIAGTELPPVKASFEAFARGAKAVNPKVEVITSYIGNWDDVSAGKEQALAQIARGVDIIFQNADAAGLGIFQAAKEKKVYAFGTNARIGGFEINQSLRWALWGDTMKWGLSPHRRPQVHIFCTFAWMHLEIAYEKFKENGDWASFKQRKITIF
jgi:basic membrane lipoprotein Med (substrate-binding protein (PBP1-ABC) superfamily)